MGAPAGWNDSIASSDSVMSRGGGLQLWRLPGGTPHATLEGHTDEIHDLAVTPDRDLLASAGKDGTVRLWRNGYWRWRDTPAGAIGLEDAERTLAGTRTGPVRARLELIAALARRAARQRAG